MLLASGLTAVGFAIGVAVMIAIESLLRKRLLMSRGAPLSSSC